MNFLSSGCREQKGQHCGNRCGAPAKCRPWVYLSWPDGDADHRRRSPRMVLLIGILSEKSIQEGIAAHLHRVARYAKHSCGSDRSPRPVPTSGEVHATHDQEKSIDLAKIALAISILAKVAMD